MLDDDAVLSVRARAFLDEHAERTPVDLEHPRRWYGCTDVHNDVVPGPEGGLERLESFVARYGGLSFCGERPGCLGEHEHQYRFDHILTFGWDQIEGDEWIATVGDVAGGYPLGLSWSTGRISVVGPQTWIANDHAWQVTYGPARPEVVMAWYRGAEGRRRIEAAVGPLQ
ncbi:hypothetical protein [Polymorphospora rubra]|uniref:hypothetical protein n=1 Tax=Polymorphospora rubra TaxID=338584 RepID=UPI0033DE96C5